MVTGSYAKFFFNGPSRSEEDNCNRYSGGAAQNPCEKFAHNSKAALIAIAVVGAAAAVVAATASGLTFGAVAIAAGVAAGAIAVATIALGILACVRMGQARRLADQWQEKISQVAVTPAVQPMVPPQQPTDAGKCGRDAMILKDGTRLDKMEIEELKSLAVRLCLGDSDLEDVGLCIVAFESRFKKRMGGTRELKAVLPADAFDHNGTIERGNCFKQLCNSSKIPDRLMAMEYFLQELQHNNQDQVDDVTVMLMQKFVTLEYRQGANLGIAEQYQASMEEHACEARSGADFLR
jgi:hypothetical protein